VGDLLNPASSSNPIPLPPLIANPDDLPPRPRLPLEEPNPESSSSSSKSLLITLHLRSKPPRLSPPNSPPPNLDLENEPLESRPPRPPLGALASGLREDGAPPSSPLLTPRWNESVLRSLIQSLRSASSSTRLFAAPAAERARDEKKHGEKGPAAPFRGGAGFKWRKGSAHWDAAEVEVAARRRRVRRWWCRRIAAGGGVLGFKVRRRNWDRGL
jgi:hypothetical protein